MMKLLLVAAISVTLPGIIISKCVQRYVEIPHNATHPKGDPADCTSGNTPLGYRCGTIPNYETIRPDILCFTITDLNNKQVEISVEALDLGSGVCFVIENADDNNVINKACGSGNAYYCGDPQVPNITVQFECDRNFCSDSDTSMWYRIATSPESEGSNMKYWCQNDRDSSRRPSSLFAQPSENPNTEQEKPTTEQEKPTTEQQKPTSSDGSILPVTVMILVCTLLAYLIN